MTNLPPATPHRSLYFGLVGAGSQPRFSSAGSPRAHAVLTACCMRTASSGYSPLAVSPESMIQSAPSRTALATSLPSARVGRGFLIMLSSIWERKNPKGVKTWQRERLLFHQCPAAARHRANLRYLGTTARLLGHTPTCQAKAHAIFVPQNWCTQPKGHEVLKGKTFGSHCDPPGEGPKHIFKDTPQHDLLAPCSPVNTKP